MSQTLNANAVRRFRQVDFAKVARAALSQSERVVSAFLPDGLRRGSEWVSINPNRVDHRPGSLSISLASGKWADFATGDRGGDLISFAAFITGKTQRQAALDLADALGVDPWA